MTVELGEDAIDKGHTTKDAIRLAEQDRLLLLLAYIYLNRNYYHAYIIIENYELVSIVKEAKKEDFCSRREERGKANLKHTNATL